MAEKRQTAQLPRDDAPETLPLAPADTDPQPLAPVDAATRPLGAPEYAALPLGALLKERHYEVVRVISSQQKLHVYLVEEDEERRVCPQCQDGQNRPQDQFCSSCGAELTAVLPTRRQYLMKESCEAEMFQAEAQLAARKLDHPHLVPIRDAFSATPYGSQPRYYVVTDSVEGTLLAQLPAPQESSQVLVWGIQLAQALEYLHTHNVAHQAVQPGSIVVDQAGRARLTQFNLAAVIPPAGRGNLGPQRYAEDVGRLVQVLHYLLTGKEKVGTASVPPAWARVLNRGAERSQVRYQAARELAADLQAILDEQQRPRSVGLRVGRRSDVGRVRTLNEDSLLTLELSQIRQSVNEPVGVYVVADGMGGHQGGEIASSLAIQAIGSGMAEAVLSQALCREWPAADKVEALLKETVQAANLQVHGQAKAMGSDMGSTVVMALLLGNRAYLANVGDSRAYWIDDHSIKQITVDHSLIQRLLDTGQVTPEEAKTHPQRSAIYRVLGDKPRVEVDTFVQTLKPGNRLLLCSDGLSGMVSNDQMQQIVVTSPDPDTACAALIDAANAAGGGDNITVIVVQMEAL